MSAETLPAWRQRLPRLAIVAALLLLALWLWPMLRGLLRGTFLQDLYPLVGLTAAGLALWLAEIVWTKIEDRLAKGRGEPQ